MSFAHDGLIENQNANSDNLVMGITSIKELHYIEHQTNYFTHCSAFMRAVSPGCKP